MPESAATDAEFESLVERIVTRRIDDAVTKVIRKLAGVVATQPTTTTQVATPIKRRPVTSTKTMRSSKRGGKRPSTTISEAGILDALKAGALRPGALAEKLGVQAKRLRGYVDTLVEGGKVKRSGSGRHALVEVVPLAKG